MVNCRYCGKPLKDSRFNFCDMDCRRNKQLSSPAHRQGTPTREQAPEYNQSNYKNNSKKLKRYPLQNHLRPYRTHTGTLNGN